jgi:hypothetical protein
LNEAVGFERERSVSSSLRQALGWIGVAMFVVAEFALVGAAQRGKPTVRQVRERLLQEVQPVTLQNCTFERFGSPNDGGYLMCANLLGNIKAAYSYGIGPKDDWGCAIAQRYDVVVHQYDCFSPPRAACSGSQSVFHDECIGPRKEAINSRIFDTLSRQVFRNGDAGKTLVVKIDVEGAELASLLATSDSMLRRIDQLAIEIHGADRQFLELVRKLKRTFYVVHLHFNNQACSRRHRPLPAWAYQVLFVNKRVGIRDPANPTPTLPHPLDAPDDAGAPECDIPKATLQQPLGGTAKGVARLVP